jgi:predicted transcriptional regulator YdeE
MAFEITNCLKEHFPALRFIGKRYTDADRDEYGSFGWKWGEWSRDSLFKALMANDPPSDKVEDGALGLMTCKSPGNTDFTYWIGLLFPARTDVPEGFQFIDLPESDVGVTWIRGKDETGEIFGEEPHNASYHKLAENGMGRLNENAGGENIIVFFERYNDTRFMTKDADGNVILDYGFYIA